MSGRLCRVAFCLFLCIPSVSSSQVNNTGKAPSIAEEQDYSFAYGLFKDGLFQLAGAQFDQFLQKYPSSLKRMDALFLSIESRFQQQQFDSAAKLYSRFVEEYPSTRLTDDAYLRLGESLLRLKRHQDAIAAFKIVLDKFGESDLAGEAAYWTGEAFVRDHDYENAIKYYLLSYEHYPKNRLRDYALYAVGWTYQTAGSYPKALEEYERFSKEFPESELFSAALVRRGECYYYMKEYRKAIEELTALRSGIKQDKERGEADYLIGEAYYNLAEYGQAKNRYESFLKDYPGHPLEREVIYDLGWAYLKLNDFSHAQQTFDRLVAGTDAMAHAGLFRRGIAEKFLGNADAALATWKEVVRKVPKGEFSDNAVYESGLVLYEGNKTAEARQMFQQVIKEYPTSEVLSDANRMLGECLVAVSDFRSAKEAFAKVLADSNASFEAKSNGTYQLAWCRFKLKEYQDAVQMFSRFIEEFPKHPKAAEARFWRAESEYQLGQFDAAAKDYRAATGAASPKREEAIYGAGWSYYKLNDFLRARKEFEDLLSAFPVGSFVFDARLRLADCLFFSKDYAGAEGAYRTVLRQFPKHEGSDYASYQLGQTYYRSGKFNDAAKQFNDLTTEYPTSSLADDAQYAIGWIWFQSKQYTEAIKDFQKLIQAYGSSDIVPRAYYSIGDSYYNQQQYTAAEKAYREVLNRFPKSQYVADAITGIQYCLLAQGKQQEALNVIDTFVKENPRSEAAEVLLLKKGDLLFGQKQYDGAVREYRGFIDRYPSSPQVSNAWYWIGMSYRGQNRLLDAAQAFERAAHTEQGSPKIRVQAFLDLGETFLSLKSYEKALAALAGIDSVDARSDLLPEAALLRGKVFEAMGRVADAHDEYNTLIRSFPATRTADEARLALARIYLDQANFSDGEQLAQKVATTRTDELGAEGQYLVGKSYALRQQWEDAITAFLKVRYVFPAQEDWLAKTYIDLGEVYERKGDLRKARDAYQSALKFERQKDIVAEAQRRLKKLERS